MLKQILLETYQPEEKLISFIKKIPDTKIKTTEGKSLEKLLDECIKEFKLKNEEIKLLFGRLKN